MIGLPDGLRFMKAQHVTHVNTLLPKNNLKKMANIEYQTMRNNGVKPLYKIKNYFINPGNTSYWHACHWYDNTTNTHTFDNVNLVVNMNPKTRKPMPTSDAFKEQANINWDTHYSDYLKNRFNQLKSILLNDVKIINQTISKNDNPLFTTKYQLRYSDNDFNQHVNHANYLKFVEDFIFEINTNFRQNKLAIYSMSLLYIKEMHVEQYKFCNIKLLDTNIIHVNDNKMVRYIGCIDVNTKQNECLTCFGFTVNLMNNIGMSLL